MSGLDLNEKMKNILYPLVKATNGGTLVYEI
jgi:hypothetical protein